MRKQLGIKGTNMNGVLSYRDFDVKLDVNNNILFSSIVISNTQVIKDKFEYLFYLLKDGVVIERGEWLSFPTKEWKIEDSGIYCAQGYVRDKEGNIIFKKSFPVSYFSKEFKDSYEDFLSGKGLEKEENVFSDDLRFVKSEYPFSDFCLVSAKQGGDRTQIKSDILEFCNECEAFKSRDFIMPNDNLLVCCYDGNPIIDGKKFGLFSGITRDEESIIIGSNNITNFQQLDELNEGYGCFTGITVDITIGSINLIRDGFGMGKIFIYQDEELFCAGNNYHSFLLFLKCLKRKLEFDDIKASIILSSCNVQLLNQNISRQMDISQIMQCPTDFDYIYKDGTWSKQRNTYGQIVHGELVALDESEYLKLVRKSVAEMKKTVQMLYADKRFSNVIVDLSGGIDSRLVYALATNMNKEQKDRTRILSYAVEGSEDLEIALDINSVFGIKWDDLPREYTSIAFHDADQYMRSRDLGIYYSFRPSVIRINHEHSPYIRFNGSFGETQARPFATRHYIDQIKDDTGMDSEELARFILQDISYKIYAPVNDEFVKKISQEIDSIGCNSVYESLESMHRQYHHGSHHHYQMYFECDEWRWPVMQSKTAQVLHHNMINTYKNAKLQFEMIGQANPIMLGFRYDYPKNNEEYERLRCQLQVGDIFSNIHNLHGNPLEKGNWEKATQIKSDNQIIHDFTGVIGDYMAKYNEHVKRKTKYLLHILLTSRPQIEEMIGIELFHYINGENVKWQYLYNKLNSFLDQIHIVETSV